MIGLCRHIFRYADMARMKNTKYKADGGSIHPIRVRQATYDAVLATEPTGEITSQVRAKISKSKREFGLRPRMVLIARTRGLVQIPLLSTLRYLFSIRKISILQLVVGFKGQTFLTKVKPGRLLHVIRNIQKTLLLIRTILAAVRSSLLRRYKKLRKKPLRSQSSRAILEKLVEVAIYTVWERSNLLKHNNNASSEQWKNRSKLAFFFFFSSSGLFWGLGGALPPPRWIGYLRAITPAVGSSGGRFLDVCCLAWLAFLSASSSSASLACSRTPVLGTFGLLRFIPGSALALATV